MSFIAREDPDLLVISATMVFHANAVREAVTRVRVIAPHLPIAVGGRSANGRNRSAAVRRRAVAACARRSAGAAHMRDDDRRYLVSYLIDAAATNDSAAFEAFVARCSADTVQALRRGAGVPNA